VTVVITPSGIAQSTCFKLLRDTPSVAASQQVRASGSASRRLHRKDGGVSPMRSTSRRPSIGPL
jgi:hypothetical protein